MPLKLIEPRKGKSPNFSIRGTYLGINVDKTSGTHRRSIAARVLKSIEEKIERGEFQEPKAHPGNVKTFADAALRYLETNHSPRYVARLVKYFGNTPIAEIDQDAIDDAARDLMPEVSPATQNTSVYTPVAAILHHGGSKIKVRRPVGSKGRVITDALGQEDAAAIILAADSFDREYGLLLRFLLYTGVRLNEALSLRWEDVQTAEQSAFIKKTKNGDPRRLRLRDDLCRALEAHQRSTNYPRVFRFRQGGWLKLRLLRAKLTALGIEMPPRPKVSQKFKAPPHRLSWCNHHTFRHTWATWMRRYGGADEIGLSQTGNWKDPRSVRRYVHAVASDEWRRADSLPAITLKAVK